MLLLPAILKFILALRFPINESIASITKRRYGEDILRAFRLLEKTIQKYNKSIADIDFLTKCKEADLVPVFLRFKLSNYRLKRSSEVMKARRKLLDKEIRDKNKRIERLSKIVTEQRMQLKSLVRVVYYIKYSQIIDETISELKIPLAFHPPKQV